MTAPGTIQWARDRFPRGLAQPPGSFRFSADALLLAAFILRRCLPETSGAALLDLGCGCGVVGLACLLGDGTLTAHGLDIDASLVTAARANAATFGLSSRFSAEELDIADTAGVAHIQPGAFDIVAANMPYRAPGSGRLPGSEARKRALFADATTVPSFMEAARVALAPEGCFAQVYPREGCERLLDSLSGHGFAAELVLPVRMTREGASRVLVRAAHAGRTVGRLVRYEPELVLHSAPAPGGKSGYTPEALAFCPWLGARPCSGSSEGRAPESVWKGEKPAAKPIWT